MLCCIDIGNTNIVIGLWEKGGWRAKFRLRTVSEKMPDEYAMLIKSIMADRGFTFEDISDIIIACVVPRLKTVFTKLFNEYGGINPLFVEPGVRTGLHIRTENPSELGADIVADAVAAYTRLGGPCVVVDFGTATTFSAVSEDGEFLGVAIAPGLEVSAEALARSTAQLPHITLQRPGSVIGKNTIHSMQAGLVYGYIGLVEYLVRKMIDEIGGDVKVIATGGLCGLIVPLTELITEMDPELTLDGLRIIGKKNFKRYEEY